MKISFILGLFFYVFVALIWTSSIFAESGKIIQTKQQKVTKKIPPKTLNEDYDPRVYFSDHAREKRLAIEIEDSIIDGESIWLKQADHQFLGIYTEAELEDGQKPKASVLILHGRGYHPDWQDVVHPLRTKLAEEGYNTLSIQMPVLEKNHSYYDYVPLFPEAAYRIDAALLYLGDAHKKIIIAHSCGFHMANFWIGRNRDHDIDAFVALSAGPTDAHQHMRNPFFLNRLRDIPVLDIYAEYDFPKALRFADRRARQLIHPQSTQKVIAGAEHFYKNKGDALFDAVLVWMDGLRF